MQMEWPMKYFHIPGRLALLTLLAVSVFFAGCAGRSAVPEPEEPLAYYQVRVQAADHWREIAIDVAEKIRSALLDRDDLLTKPVYVVPPPTRPFMAAFHQFLKTEMVSRAMQVSERRESDSLVLKYDVLAIAFDPSRMGFIRPSGASDHEIVVNVRMAYNNRYVRHLSYIHYINDDDWRQYTGSDARTSMMLAGEPEDMDGMSSFWSRYQSREPAFGYAVGGRTSAFGGATGYQGDYQGGYGAYPQSGGYAGGAGGVASGGAGGRYIDPNAPVTPFPKGKR